MNLADLEQKQEAEKSAARALLASIDGRADKKATDAETKQLEQYGLNIENYSKQITAASKLMDQLKAGASTVTAPAAGVGMAAAVAAAAQHVAPAQGAMQASGGDGVETFSLEGATRKHHGAAVVEFKNPAPGKRVFKNFGEQLQAIFLADNPYVTQKDKEMAINMLNSVNQYSPSGLSSLKDSDGGYLIEEETMQGILKQEFEVGQLAADCRKVPIGAGKNRFEAFALDDNSRVDGSRLGGIVAYWVDEADTVAASKPKLRRIEFGLGKLMAIGYATRENLEDAGQLAAMFGPGFADEMAYMIDDAVLNSDGGSVNAIKGILSSTNKALITIALQGGQSTKIMFENVLKMYNSMPARFLSGAKWYINQELMDYLPFMKLDLGTNVYPVFLPPGAVASGGMYGTLMGRPIVPIEQAAAAGSKGDITFANMDQYLIGTKGGVGLDVSMHVRFLNDETAFRATQRIGGQPLPNNIFTPAKGSKTYSPFITLAGGR